MNFLKNILPFLCLLLFGCNNFNKNKNVIYLIGDSTMSEKKAESRPETGWGEMLGDYFVEGIKIENHAKNGRSTRSFIAEERWIAVLEKLKKDDVVLIQFGHNDTKEGDRFSTPKEYGINLQKFVTETRSKKAIPVLLTSINRRRFDENGKFYDTHGAYPNVVRRLAKEEKVPMIDLHKSTARAISEMGEKESESIFLFLKKGEHPNYPDGVSDNTHFSPKGAKFMADLAVQEIRNLDLPIKKYLKNP